MATSAFDPQTSLRRFHIGCSDHAAQALLTVVLPGLLRDAPGGSLLLLHAGCSNAVDLICAGTLALGVLNSADKSIAVLTLRELPYPQRKPQTGSPSSRVDAEGSRD